MAPNNSYRGVRYDPIVEAESGTQGDPAHKQPSFGPWQTIPRWKALLVACPIFIFTLVWTRSVLDRHVNTGAKESSQLAILLHPELHINREPTTLRFDWNISTGFLEPDGVRKRIYLVNGQFPGPTIEARSGDRIVVRVRNKVLSEDVSIHWHGLRMKGYNAMDGALGFTQCGIGGGKEFEYDFRIGDEEHGTFWWHSHSHVQRGDGMYGGLVIHKPGQQPSSERQYLLLIGDWFHRKQSDVLEWFADAVSNGNEPVPDSMLINGQGRYNCSLIDPEHKLACNSKALSSMLPLFSHRENARLRFVNVGTVAGVSVAIDGARLKPAEVDGGNPLLAISGDSVGILYPGERFDAYMSWHDDDVKLPCFNMYLDDENFSFVNHALTPEQAFAAITPTIQAKDVSHPKPLKAWKNHVDLAGQPSALSPVTNITESDYTLVFYLKTQIEAHFDHKPLGHFNHTTWQPQQTPLLALNRAEWNEHQLVPFVASDQSKPAVVTIVLNNLDDGAHPIHLHGNSFYVLLSHKAEGRTGWGSYNPFDPDEELPEGLDLKAPKLKDTVAVPRRGHVVLRFVADNPGLWMMHCHMLVHMGTGMVAGLHVGDAGDEQHVAGIEAAASKLCAKSV